MKPVVAGKQSKGTWKCPAGCDQAFFLKKGGGGCPHLEKLLARPFEGHDTRKLTYAARLDVFDQNRVEMYSGNDHDDEAALRTKLAAHGLSDKKISVVIDRMVYGRTYKEIAIDQGYAELSVAKRAFDDALKILKKNGYRRTT